MLSLGGLNIGKLYDIPDQKSNCDNHPATSPPEMCNWAGDIMISRFGKFQVKDKKNRRGRNPQTGNALVLDARRVVTFKCSSSLK